MGKGRTLDLLLPEAATGDGPEVAAEMGFRWRPAGSLSALLEGVREGTGPALISAGSEGVDAPVVERIAEAVADRGLLISAPGASLEWAVLARRVGAGSLLSEPLLRVELAAALRRHMEEPIGLEITPSPGLPDRSGPARAPDGPELVGRGAGMMTVVRGIAELGPSQVTVLLTGESGVGKEVVAKALHWASPRRGGPFVPINCAAIPETLLEAEFFGHEKGAFTGALAAKPGRFERAKGGTLFLDEVGDMSAILQAKLLRALEEREIERLGGAGPIPVDVRVLAATNQPLEARVASGDFREDLFYRLAVARLRIPPLRERREDLPELIVFFVRRFSETYGRRVRGVTDDALRVLDSHDWPGNVRELRNVLDRAVMNSHGGWIRSDDLSMGADAPSVSSPRPGAPVGGYPPSTPLEEVERDHIARVLDFTHGALAEAAEILGIHRNTLTRKLDRFGLRAGGST